MPRAMRAAQPMAIARGCQFPTAPEGDQRMLDGQACWSDVAGRSMSARVALDFDMRDAAHFIEMADL